MAGARQRELESKFKESKAFENTNAGPEQSNDLQAFQADVRSLRKEKIRKDLLDQIQSDQERRIELERLVRDQDLRDVVDDLERRVDEDKEKKQKDVENKERNARIWIEQSN